MNGPAAQIAARFGAVEDAQNYTSLLELFADDAVYFDPFMGAQRGHDQLRAFMSHMEELVPAAGATFADWRTVGDRNVAWATWIMVAGPDRLEVPGQSLYRIGDDDKVQFVADYVDSAAYARLRPDGPTPDLSGAAGISAGMAGSEGAAVDVIRRFWEIQDTADYTRLTDLFAPDAVFTDQVYGRFEGRDTIAAYMARMASEMPERGITFELVDVAGDDTVAWSQWWCVFPNGRIPGWTLHTVRDGMITLDADYFDVAAARRLSGR
jgi:ketosteroid isomerase-like protein